MPGPEDYPYTPQVEPSSWEPLTTEVSAADSNPAYYPAEAKSESMRTEDEKKALKEAEENTQKAKGETDVVNGQGETLVTKEYSDALAEKEAGLTETNQQTAKSKSIPKSKQQSS